MTSQSPNYRDLLQSLRGAFPSPVSNRQHDAYFAFNFLRVLDQVDSMKSERPLLGSPVQPDYDRAVNSRLAMNPSTLEEVNRQLVQQLEGMFIWGHPRSQSNVVTAPTIASIVAGLLPSIYNPNLCSEETAHGIAEAELKAISMTADLVGYDPARAGGLFTFGGTGTLFYGIRLGVEKACRDAMRKGIEGRALIFCSQQAHFAVQSTAGWLGLGTENVVKIATNESQEIRIDELEAALRDALSSGKRVAAIVATMGSTDAFGLDDLKAICQLRDRLAKEFDLDYRPHVHADAVIGWAWSVFNDYDTEENPLQFPNRTIRAIAGTSRRIRHLSLADSLGVDYHKTGYTPYISSAILVRDVADLDLIARDTNTTPYLFNSGTYHPGLYSIETSRSGQGPMAALANLLLFGKNGLRVMLGHVVTMSESLRDHLGAHEATTVMNRENFGPVTLFRAYPEGVDTFEEPHREMTDPDYVEQLRKNNDYNRRLYARIYDRAIQGEGVVISMTDRFRESNYGEPIVALKSYILSPFSEEQYVDAVLDSIWEARNYLEQPDLCTS